MIAHRLSSVVDADIILVGMNGFYSWMFASENALAYEQI